jgi:hypothetical protein
VTVRVAVTGEPGDELKDLGGGGGGDSAVEGDHCGIGDLGGAGVPGSFSPRSAWSLASSMMPWQRMHGPSGRTLVMRPGMASTVPVPCGLGVFSMPMSIIGIR